MRRKRVDRPEIKRTGGKLYIGVDNGVSGSIGWSGASSDIVRCGQVKTPVISQQNYTKAKGNITRVDFPALKTLLFDLGQLGFSSWMAVLERPMVNPQRFFASASALRALESTLIVLELLGIPYQYVDSKEWQREMLPKGIKGPELKKASCEIGQRLFPSIECKPDADGLLMAEWARRKGL